MKFKRTKNLSMDWHNQYIDIQTSLKNGPVKIIRPSKDKL